MNKTLLAIALTAVVSPLRAQLINTAYPFDESLLPPSSAINTITATELRKHLTFIASDELKGRDTGSPELDVAARYIAAHLESYGFKGLGKDGSFFQPVPLHQTAYKIDSLSIKIGKKNAGFEIGKDAAVYGMGTADLIFESPLLFVGEGLHTEAHKSYAPEDVKGKIVIRTHLEGEKAELARSNPEYTHQGIRNKLFGFGAKAVVLVVNDNDAATQLIRLYSTFAKQPNLGLKAGDNQGAYIILSKAGYGKLLAASGLNADKLAKSGQLPVFKATASFHLPSAYKQVLSKNVVAVLEGSDAALKSEYVGFGAHYDHVGYQDTLIFNGADDDGSGTVGLLNIAQAMSVARPKRSVVVVFHTGEEKGLFGSEYFAANPLVPLASMVAMVNMDMIGSDYETGKVHVVGANRISNELHDINEKVNATRVNMTLDYTYNDDNHPERIYYRSDHYNYAKNGVPVIFYTNDNPLHYHKHTDEVSTINFPKMERIARLAFQTGYYVASKKDRLVLNPVAAPAGTK
jgi:hypothetical protein